MEQKQTVGQATASLILGILSLILFGILTAIPAVICGHIAKSKIKLNPEKLQGDGLAMAGLVMGYITIGLSVLLIPLMVAIAIPAFTQARASAMEMHCHNNMRIIDTAKAQYAVQSSAPTGSPVTEQEIGVYIPGGFSSVQCLKGEYTIHPIGTAPECSKHGSLPTKNGE